MISQLIKNETLASFALSYGFEKRAKLPGDLMVTNRGSKEEKKWRKVLGDMFEAYVAAVVLGDPEHGFTTVEEWMRELWAPILAADDPVPSSSHPLISTTNPTATNPQSSGDSVSTATQVSDFPKVTLSQKVMGKGIKLDYRHEINPDIVRRQARRDGKEKFKIGVYLTGWGFAGVCLGQGEGLNKVEAGDQAAIRALGHPITAEAEGRKRVFDHGVRRKREKEKEKEAEAEAEAEAGDG